MGCHCSEKLKKLVREVQGKDKGVEEANREDGPYWGRMVASNFLSSVGKRPLITKCNCQSAQRINTALRYLRSKSVKSAIAEGGGGTILDRLSQNTAYATFKELLTGKPQKVKPVGIMIIKH